MPAAAASQICGMAAPQAATQNRRMTAQAPLDVYRQFQSFLISGQYGRLAEVADMDGYTERCVGLTGWTTGLQAALRNFQENIASRLTGMVPTENDIVQTGDMLVIRGSYEVTHSGEFLGVQPTGRRVSYDWIDMYRVTDGRIVWRYLLCDWKGLLGQLTARQASAQSDQAD
jgi:predicted ester cyclase